MSWVVVAVATTAVSIGSQAYQGRVQRRAARSAERKEKASLKKAEQIQKAGEMTAFNSAQRAGRISAARGSNVGAQGTILGGGQSLSGANQGTQTVGAKTLLGQ